MTNATAMIRLTIRWNVIKRRHALQVIEEASAMMSRGRPWKRADTHKPGDSSSLTFLRLRRSRTKESCQSSAMSTAQAKRTRWASSRVDESMPVSPMEFGRWELLTSAPFQEVALGRTKISWERQR